MALPTWSKPALDVLKAVAPTVATALGGPLAGTATSMLLAKLGGDAKDAKAVEAALTAGDPATMLALHKLEDDFKAHMADVGVTLAQLAYADTASARAREMAVRDWTPRLIAWCVVALTFGLEGALILGWHRPSGIPGEVLGRILGTLDSALILVLGYYFGSSAGARASGDALAEIAKQP
jgi:hypothetical protein